MMRDPKIKNKRSSAKGTKEPATGNTDVLGVPAGARNHPRLAQIAAKLAELQKEKAEIEDVMNRLKKQHDDTSEDISTESGNYSLQSSLSMSSMEDSRPHTPRKARKSLQSTSTMSSLLTEENDKSSKIGPRSRLATTSLIDLDSCSAGAHYNSGIHGTAGVIDDDDDVPIVWAKGLQYRHQEPDIDESMFVEDEKSLYDALTLSSNDDSILMAAEKDLPAVIEIKAGDSVGSGLHSEFDACSISIVVRPADNDFANPKKNSTSNLRSSKNLRRSTSAGAGRESQHRRSRRNHLSSTDRNGHKKDALKAEIGLLDKSPPSIEVFEDPVVDYQRSRYERPTSRTLDASAGTDEGRLTRHKSMLPLEIEVEDDNMSQCSLGSQMDGVSVAKANGEGRNSSTRGRHTRTSEWKGKHQMLDSSNHRRPSHDNKNKVVAVPHKQFNLLFERDSSESELSASELGMRHVTEGVSELAVNSDNESSSSSSSDDDDDDDDDDDEQNYYNGYNRGSSHQRIIPGKYSVASQRLSGRGGLESSSRHDGDRNSKSLNRSRRGYLDDHHHHGEEEYVSKDSSIEGSSASSMSTKGVDTEACLKNPRSRDNDDELAAGGHDRLLSDIDDSSNSSLTSLPDGPENDKMFFFEGGTGTKHRRDDSNSDALNLTSFSKQSHRNSSALK